MRYVVARIEEEKKATTYRFYVTDALYAIGKLNVRYSTLVTGKEEKRTEAEIVSGIRDKLAKLEGGEVDGFDGVNGNARS